MTSHETNVWLVGWLRLMGTDKVDDPGLDPKDPGLDPPMEGLVGTCRYDAGVFWGSQNRHWIEGVFGYLGVCISSRCSYMFPFIEGFPRFTFSIYH